MKEEIISRVDKLLASMAESSVDAVLIANEEHSTKNLRYFSNFTGSTGYLLISRDKQMIFTDSRYWEQTLAQSPLTLEKIKELRTRPFVARFFQNYKRIGFEAKALTVDFFNGFEALLPPDVEWIPVDGMISEIRCSKSVLEKNKIIEANKIAIDAFKKVIGELKAGMTEKDIDTIARDIITDEGYGEYFGHGLGHGIGLEVHEEPRVSQINTNALPVGAVVTIEPGIYLPNRFGVRIENDIFLGLETTEVLTVFPTDLIIV